MSKISFNYKEGVAAFRPVTSLSKVDRNHPAFHRAMLTYRSAEAVSTLFGVTREEGVLFLRTENPHALLQMSIPVQATGLEDRWHAVVDIAKLQEALTSLKKGRKAPETATLAVNKASVKLGGILIKTEDPQVLNRTPEGIANAESIGMVPNPWTKIKRAEHCVGDEGIPAMVLLPGQIMGAHMSQAILVDCDLVTVDEKIMVPARELAYVKYLDDTLEVRLSKQFLLFRGGMQMLAVRRQMWSRSMDEPIKLFRETNFVDEIVVNREELVDALKTAKKVLGKDASGMLTFQTGKGTMHSTVEGNSTTFDFDTKVMSGKTYQLGLVLVMLLNAVEHTPSEQIVFKVPDTNGGPVNMIHLVDQGSHEVIGLGVTGQLKEC